MVELEYFIANRINILFEYFIWILIANTLLAVFYMFSQLNQSVVKII